MTALRRSTFLAFALLLPGGLLIPGDAGAHDYRLGSLRIDHPWAVATPKGAKVGVGYMKITNDGTQPDRLVRVSSPVARKVAVHDMTHDGGVMKMRQLDNGIEIKPGETIELTPHGKHVMFEDLTAPLTEGARVKSTLVFEKAGSIEVEYAVEPLGTKAPMPPAHRH